MVLSATPRLRKQVAVRARVFVEAWPEDVFCVFIAEVGLGLRSTGWSWIQPERGRYLRFNRDVSGRFVEAYDAVADTGEELGRVTAWEPGACVAFGWRQMDWPQGVSTEVDVRFEPVFGGTLLSVEHSGFGTLGPDLERSPSEYRAAWNEAIGWVARRVRLESSAHRGLRGSGSPSERNGGPLRSGPPSLSHRM